MFKNCIIRNKSQSHKTAIKLAVTRDTLSVLTSRSCALRANSRNSFHLISLAFFLSKLYCGHPLCFLRSAHSAHSAHSALMLYLQSIMQRYMFVIFIVKIPFATRRKNYPWTFIYMGNAAMWRFESSCNIHTETKKPCFCYKVPQIVKRGRLIRYSVVNIRVGGLVFLPCVCCCLICMFLMMDPVTVLGSQSISYLMFRKWARISPGLID